ncbi:hypothetical protein GCM10009122_52020 [Fulvivirga kasyanovii]|uniref:Phospholipase/carboxylesterase/thioesterase domain-containing protein n=1 Tax=Fulvivirga kasyanovii TaxID=396812 RepID=A0ABW9RMN6_9BACT|nr:hypothetical protein [Fulvivirga kasyanovii]MTI25210.1 hypothetical protein [Fulvivirga kasyanovii]
MNRFLYLSFVVVALFFLTCSEDDGNITPREPEGQCAEPGPPTFLKQPSGVYDGSNFKIRLRTDIPSTLYYFISDFEVTDKEAEKIKARALSGNGLVAANTTQVDCEEIGEDFDIEIGQLPENTKLFAYVTAESFVSDTLLQEEIGSFSFSINEGSDSVVTCELEGPPAFTSEPKGLYGTRSFDFVVETDIPSSLYYIISKNELSDKSPANIRQKVLEGANFLAADSARISCDSLSKAMTITVTDLPKETQLYAYIVAESYVSDTVLQTEVTEFAFATQASQTIETFFSNVKGRDALYVRYLPDEAAFKYPENKVHPLIIFLGGNGEVSPPGEIYLIQNGSIPKYIDSGHDIPFIVIAPEHNTEDWNNAFIHEMVEFSMENYSVDPDRIIITGMSGGGIGTFSYAISHPEIPAAIVPVSGEGEVDEVCAISDMAVWAFHNTNDPKVPTSGSIDMINALRNCNPAPTEEVNLTIFADEGHNCWIRVYNPESITWEYDPSVQPIDIYEWMYQQSK